MSQAQYSKTAESSVLCIQAYNNHSIHSSIVKQWQESMYKDIIFLQPRDCSPFLAGEACELWEVGSMAGTSHGGVPGMGGRGAHPLGHGLLSSHKLTLSPVKSLLTFTSVAPLNIHEKNPTSYWVSISHQCWC